MTRIDTILRVADELRAADGPCAAVAATKALLEAVCLPDEVVEWVDRGYHATASAGPFEASVSVGLDAEHEADICGRDDMGETIAGAGVARVWVGHNFPDSATVRAECERRLRILVAGVEAHPEVRP